MGGVTWEGAAEVRPERLWGYAKGKRERVMSAGIEWNGHLVQTDPVSRSNIASEALAAQAGTRPDPDTYRMADNTMPELSNAEILDMATAVREHVKAAYAVSWQARAAIDAGEITTEEQIDGLAWPGGGGT